MEEEERAPATVKMYVRTVEELMVWLDGREVTKELAAWKVRYITVEAVLAGRAETAPKGKIRTIMLPGKLCWKLLKYARKRKIASGEVFLTRSGKSPIRVLMPRSPDLDVFYSRRQSMPLE